MHRALARLGLYWIWSQAGGCKNWPINSRKSVGQLGLTAGKSCTGIQANTVGILPVDDIHKIVNKFTRSDFRKIARKTPTFIDKCFTDKSDSWLHLYLSFIKAC